MPWYFQVPSAMLSSGSFQESFLIDRLENLSSANSSRGVGCSTGTGMSECVLSPQVDSRTGDGMLGGQPLQRCWAALSPSSRTSVHTTCQNTQKWPKITRHGRHWCKIKDSLWRCAGGAPTRGSARGASWGDTNHQLPVKKAIK